MIARTTSMAYRAAREPLREIGRKVKADYALEGAVRKVGDHLHVTAQLYRLKEETPVWAKAFEATGNDVLWIQRTLAAHLAGSLALAFDTAEMRPAPSVAAQEALAKARYLRNKHEPDAIVPSLGAFEDALRLDPENALAWSELSMAYDAAAGVLPASEAMDKACAAAKRARELSSKEALATRPSAFARCSEIGIGRRPRPRRERARQESGLASAHHCHAAFLSAAGRHVDAVRAIERAKALDPLSPAIVADAGWHAYLGREYQAAIREFERTLELEPKGPWSREHLMTARALAGDAEGAAKEASTWASMFPLTDDEKASLASVAPADAVRSTSGVIAKRWAARAKALDGRPNPGFIAAKYAGAGDQEETLAWLERAASEHAPWCCALARSAVRRGARLREVYSDSRASARSRERTA